MMNNLDSALILIAKKDRQITQLKAEKEMQADTIKECHRRCAELATKLADALKEGE